MSFQAILSVVCYTKRQKVRKIKLEKKRFGRFSVYVFYILVFRQLMMKSIFTVKELMDANALLFQEYQFIKYELLWLKSVLC